MNAMDYIVPMTFQAWADQKPRGILREVSDTTGVSYSTVLRIYAGKPAGPKAARIISAFTKGAVSVESLRVGLLAGEATP